MKTKTFTLLAIAGIITTGALAYAADNGSGVTKEGVKQRFEKRISLSGTGFSMIGNNHGRGMFQGMKGKKTDNLTDAENTSLKSMTTEEKQAFFEKRRTEMQAKIEAHEAVIDKLINGEELTDSEKTILAEIKTQRSEAKKQKKEMQAKIDEIKPILEKKRAGSTLTQDEQTKLNDFMLNNKGILKFKGSGK